MRLCLLRLFAFAALVLSLGAPSFSPAQEMSRQQRLREHERRIREIIETRREAARKEEEERAAAPEEPAAEEEPPPADEERRRTLSNVVMGFKFTNEEGQSNYNTIVEEGDTFLTEIYLFNTDRNPIDRVRLALRYDRRFIDAVRVFDTAVRPFVDGEPIFEKDDQRAIIYYDAPLARPMADREVVLLRILWRAQRRTAFTPIEFFFDQLERDEELHTAIYGGGQNILGTRQEPHDGVISGGLMIEAPRDEAPVLQGKGEELRELYLGSVASTDVVGLQLVPPQKGIRVGDVFKVPVRLNNPNSALVDSVHFFVMFDPKVLQVVDMDEFNWMSRGVNVHDGPYHFHFPWDMHKANEVRNDRGMINYQKSLSNGAVLPSQTVADIYFRALAPTSGTEMFFVRATPADFANTSVRYFGYERLDLESKISTPIIHVPVLPLPLQVAERRRRLESPVEVAPQPEQSAIRPLLIER